MDGILRALGLGPFHQLARHEQILAVISVGVGVLFALTVAFACMVIVLRAGHLRRRRRNDLLMRQWEGPLLEVLGGAPAHQVRALVRPGDELALLAFLIRYARRLRGEESRRLAAIAGRFLPHAERALRSRIPERRAQAAQILAAFGMPVYTAQVLRALDDRSPFVAMIAAQALARQEHAEHAPEVVRRLWRFTDWSAEYLAAMLARVGPPIAAPTRLLLADRGAGPHTRAVAAEVLRRLNDPASADVAAEVLRHGVAGHPASHAPLVAAALQLLAAVGHAEHLDTVRLYARSPHATVRAAAMRALAVLGGTREASTLAAALTDDSHWVNREAARGLARLGRFDLLRRHADGDGVHALLARQVLAEEESA